jgi:hypothetical protein
MAMWRAGTERAYVALKHPNNPNERITCLYREGEVFFLPDDMKPSRTWRPMDEAAVAICRRIATKHMKEPPKEPEDPDDDKQARKYQRLLSTYTMQQDAERTWFGADTYMVPVADTPMALAQIAAAKGKSVRVSDQPT